ncbi:hypothetical protein BaRGS_00008557 [Batillaria attramentaria]|uniref:Uncharacterized protein n=1 Tax=Batillaria attramentaria TaxID=370345 RepID=A0ABD0LMV1_9CAEN
MAVTKSSWASLSDLSTVTFVTESINLPSSLILDKRPEPQPDSAGMRSAGRPVFIPSFILQQCQLGWYEAASRATSATNAHHSRPQPASPSVIHQFNLSSSASRAT